MTEKTKEVLVQAACYVAVGIVSGIGPALPLTSCLACVGGSVIFAYLYKCMRGQPLRLMFLISALLWLWGNTALTLLDFTNAPLALALLVLGCVLVTGRGRWARLGAFLLPVGALSLIPYGLRDPESCMVMAGIAFVLLIIGLVCYLCRTLLPRFKWLVYSLPYLLITALYTWLMVSLRLSPDEVLPAAAGLFVFLSPDWCAILSRRCMQACGMQNPWWLGTCSALSCLAPLGALNFLYNIKLYFLYNINLYLQ